jgi:hypothetical protein
MNENGAYHSPASIDHSGAGRSAHQGQIGPDVAADARRILGTAARRLLAEQLAAKAVLLPEGGRRVRPVTPHEGR